jgi:hypothetical protein
LAKIADFGRVGDDEALKRQNEVRTVLRELESGKIVSDKPSGLRHCPSDSLHHRTMTRYGIHLNSQFVGTSAQVLLPIEGADLCFVADQPIPGPSTPRSVALSQLVGQFGADTMRKMDDIF